MKKLYSAAISLLLIFILTGNVRAQQLPLYSEYMFNILEINPAYAGFRNSIQFTSSFRKQFNGIKSSPQTALASFDMPVGDSKLGVGVRVMDDRFSVISTQGIHTALSYHIETGEYSKLYMGLQGGVITYKANLTDLVQADFNDPIFQNDQRSVIGNFGAGLFFASEKFYAGVSVPNLFRPNLRPSNIAATADATKQALHGYLNAGYMITLNDNFTLKPSVLVRAVQGVPMQYDINANIFFRELVAGGVSYRTNSAVTGLLNFKINYQLSIGYAFDYNTSRLTDFNKGTHEIMIRYQIPFWKDDPLPSFLF